MAVPDNRHNMLRAGYVLQSKDKFSVCKDCSEFIEWWKTTNGKNIPFNPAGERDPAVCHWGTCTKSRNPAALPAPSGPALPLAALTDELKRLRSKHKARVIVVVSEEGYTAVWQVGLTGEELRSDLIEAGNSVRARIQQEGGL